MTATAAAKPETNVKDTIESIIVAFILAFVFRCFVIEAFVIPTGSMAPTLLGAHMHFRCPDCGYRFTAGYGISDQQSFSIPSYATVVDANKREQPKTYGLFCPNCGYRLPREMKEDPANDATGPAVRYGDRILVMKYLYLLHEPQRWDVVVFKSPATDTGDYSVNYIKRLIATPGESAFVAHGDVYVADPGKPINDPASYRVQPKPRHVQDALWRIVFDGDYVPVLKSRNYEIHTGRGTRVLTDDKWQTPWRQTAGSGWINSNTDAGVSERAFRFDNGAGSGTLTFDPQANPTTSAMTDWLPYDQSEHQPGIDSLDQKPWTPAYNVADLKIAFTSSGIADAGELRPVLSKIEDGNNRTEVVAELSAGKARVVLRTPHGESVIGEKEIDLRGQRSISLENVDYRITLRIDGKDLIVSTPDQYAPSVQMTINSLGRAPAGAARIEGDKLTTTLTHLQLWRDVYYRDKTEDRTSADFLRATAVNFPKMVVTLGQDEFFTLGDNSAMSLDGRFWSTPIKLPGEELDVPAGVVPRRFMLGKAFFVYWPAGFRPSDSVPLGIVPNFGEMRFIR